MADNRKASRRPRLTLRPEAPRHGEMVVLSLAGLEPQEHVTVKAVAVETHDTVEHEVDTDARGAIDTALRLPAADCEVQHWTFSATGADGALRAATPPVPVMPQG